MVQDGNIDDTTIVGDVVDSMPDDGKQSSQSDEIAILQRRIAELEEIAKKAQYDYVMLK
jgi:hypothetical protein